MQYWIGYWQKKKRTMNKNSTRINVQFFHRKPRKVGNYSLEFIFADVRERLKAEMDAGIVYSKYESAGLFKRIYNVLEAYFKQSKVNHVTGDINYIGLLLKPKRTVHTILDCVHLATTSGIKHKILKLFWVSIPVKRSKFVTAISTATKNELLKYVTVDPNKIVVIPVAIADDFEKVDKPFNTVCPTILQLGAAPNKNIERLLEAVKDIKCKVVIIGARHQHLVDYMQQHNIEFEYKQGLTDAEIRQAYVDADIVTLTSTYEGFGMPILEAQATGRVVITSNIFSMPEVGGDAAYYVDPYKVEEIKQGIAQLIHNETLRNKLIEKGFDNIKRFNANVIAHQYLELYKKIAEQ
jgi:glycosyltransferase involved in cell wall biosynthesis